MLSLDVSKTIILFLILLLISAFFGGGGCCNRKFKYMGKCILCLHCKAVLLLSQLLELSFRCFVVYLLDRVSLCNLGCPGTHRDPRDSAF